MLCHNIHTTCVYIIYCFYGSTVKQRIKMSIDANYSILTLMLLLKCQLMCIVLVK